MKRLLTILTGLICFTTVPAQTPGSNGGNAIRFDGVDDAMQATSQQTTVYNNFTIEAWVNPTAAITIYNQNIGSTEGSPFYGGSNRYLIMPPYGGFFGDADTYASAGLTVGNNGVCVFEHGNYYMPPILAWAGIISGWTHIAVVYTNRQPELFVNGMKVKTGLTSRRLKVFVGNAQFGGGDYGHYQGSVDEIRIWEIALSEAQIKERMCRRLTNTDALFQHLINYYKLDEASGDSVLDYSSSANNAVLVNGPVRLESGIPADCSVLYCTAGANNSDKGFIGNVFACYGFDHSSGFTGYADYSNFTVTSAPGKLIGLSVTPAYILADHTGLYITVYVDWNADGDFADAGEMVFAPTYPTNVKTKFYVRVPAGTAAGTKKMRVTVRSDKHATACGAFGFGETEDYSIEVTAERPGLNATADEAIEEAGKTFSVYPNPAVNQFVIERSGYNELLAWQAPVQMTLSDVHGKILIKASLTGLVQQFNTSNIAPGVYFVTIFNGDHPVVSRIVISR